MVYNVLVFAEKETTELPVQYKTHAELQIKRLEK